MLNLEVIKKTHRQKCYEFFTFMVLESIFLICIIYFNKKFYIEEVILLELVPPVKIYNVYVPFTDEEKEEAEGAQSA